MIFPVSICQLHHGKLLYWYNSGDGTHISHLKHVGDGYVVKMDRGEGGIPTGVSLYLILPAMVSNLLMSLLDFQLK